MDDINKEVLNSLIEAVPAGHELWVWHGFAGKQERGTDRVKVDVQWGGGILVARSEDEAREIALGVWRDVMPSLEGHSVVVKLLVDSFPKTFPT